MACWELTCQSTSILLLRVGAARTLKGTLRRPLDARVGPVGNSTVYPVGYFVVLLHMKDVFEMVLLPVPFLLQGARQLICLSQWIMRFNATIPL